MTAEKATQHGTNVGCVETQPIGKTNVRCSLLSASTNDSTWPKRIYHVWFGCLKKAWREHRMENCIRRQLCSKQENGKQSKHYHHPLLHKSNAIRLGVAALAAGKGALLPVMSAIIHSQNGIQTKGYILLDTGAQVSLIRSDIAELLRLKGRDTSVTTAKVGGGRGNHKNKGIPSTCRFWRWLQEVFDNCHWNTKHQWWRRRSSSNYTDHRIPGTIQRED